MIKNGQGFVNISDKPTIIKGKVVRIIKPEDADKRVTTMTALPLIGDMFIVVIRKPEYKEPQGILEKLWFHIRHSEWRTVNVVSIKSFTFKVGDDVEFQTHPFYIKSDLFVCDS